MASERITEFEKARVLGDRAEQISRGSPVKINANGETDPLRLARMELLAGEIKFIIKRQYPDGKVVEVLVSDLIIP